MKRLLLPSLAIAAAVSVSACGHSAGNTANPPQTTVITPTSGQSASAAPSAPSSPASPGVPEFSVDGTGQYELGTKLTDAQTVGLANVVAGGTTCPQDTTANGVGAFKDVQFSFGADGVMFLAVNKSPSIPTPSGAWLGTNVSKLKTIYAGIQADTLTSGTNTALLVTTLSGRGILFGLNAQGNVVSMTAGDATYLKTTFSAGKPFC